ncbi:hypothetical protein [Luteimonas sp. SDU101]|uniref:hypothetical protein n=1 Tax=Luteimonas sp. SDU101 TaxID=3422593 RepID=UPI003EBB7CE5
MALGIARRACRGVALHAPLDAGDQPPPYLHGAGTGLGEPRFQAMVEKALSRPAAVRPRGRPVRVKEVEGRVG